MNRREFLFSMTAAAFALSSASAFAQEAKTTAADNQNVPEPDPLNGLTKIQLADVKMLTGFSDGSCCSFITD